MIGHVSIPGAFALALTLEETLPGCVIYGGFWRDVLLQKPVRDIDVAIMTNSIVIPEGYKPQRFKNGDYQHDRIEQIYQQGDIQLIEFSTSVSAVEMNRYVDTGICAVAWSKAEGLVLDPTFLHDVAHELIVVKRHDWGQEGVERHLNKLQDKFPNYEVVW